MKTFFLIVFSLFLCLNTVFAEGEPKNPLPPVGTGEESENRDISSPQLFQGDSSVYVYSEKQLDLVGEEITMDGIVLMRTILVAQINHIPTIKS